MKLRIYQNEDFGVEVCPACCSEFSSPYSMTACEHCGYISFGCNMCPLDYSQQTNKTLKATCNRAGCPAKHPVENLYAIYSRKEFDSLPEAYRGHVVAKRKSYMHLLLNDRVVPIYTTRRVVGITTIDMYEWRKGNKKLTGTPTIYNILGDELI